MTAPVERLLRQDRAILVAAIAAACTVLCLGIGMSAPTARAVPSARPGGREARRRARE